MNIAPAQFGFTRLALSAAMGLAWAASVQAQSLV